MATLLAGGFFASRALFKYNRKNFMFDKKLKQKREFQEQVMRVEQFTLYREDVRDLVELTVAKMDLYLVAAALLVDRTTVMISKTNEALPPGSPEWAVALHAISLASAVFYLLLCLWLAMYASISAQSFGTRLLTQFVRLPYASQEQILNASADAMQFEEKNLTELMRVPLVRAGLEAATIRDPRIAQQTAAEGITATLTRAGSMEGDPDILVPNQALLPTAMLEHIRLYRRVQLNWQAYDAYARVSLFIGANSLLYSCLYWSLGSWLQDDHGTIPALATAIIFATVQALLCKLDLRLRAAEMFWIGMLLATTPIVTTSGMLIYKHLQGRTDPPEWEKRLMELCAVVAHVLHTIVAGLTLSASWPDSARDEDALLPGKFRSTLYLDVFGWLLNSTGPGATDQRDEFDEEGEEEQPDEGGPNRQNEEQSASTELPTSSSSRQPVISPSPTTSGVFSSTYLQRVITPIGASSSSFSPQQGPAAPHTTAGSAPSTFLSRVLSAPAPSASSFPANNQATARGRSPGISTSFAMEASRNRSPAPSASSFTVEAGRSNPRAVGKRNPSNRSSAGDSSIGNAQRDGPLGTRSLRRNSFTNDFSDDLKREARRLLHPDSQPEPENATQEERFGGSESMPMEVAAGITAPSAAAIATFTQAIPTTARVSRKTPLPGSTPWSAFLRGTVVIVSLWSLSTLWSIGVVLIGGGWGYSKRNVVPALLMETSSEFVGNSSIFIEAICRGPPVDANQILHKTYLDFGCGMQKPFLDVSVTCDDSRRCFAVILRRGGRSLDLCALRSLGRLQVLILIDTARVVPGAPSLETIAATIGRSGKLSDLRIFGRASKQRRNATFSKDPFREFQHWGEESQDKDEDDSGGSLIAFSLSGLMLHRQSVLVPSYVVASAANSRTSSRAERLLVLNDILLSVQPLEKDPRADCDVQFGLSPGRVQLRAWKLTTGETSTLTLTDPSSNVSQVSQHQRPSELVAIKLVKEAFGCQQVETS